jgi:hypothetical protein
MIMKTMKVLMNINVEQFTGSISELCVAIVNEMYVECNDDDNDMNEE